MVGYVTRATKSRGEADEREDIIRERLDNIQYPGYSYRLVRFYPAEEGVQFFVQLYKITKMREDVGKPLELQHYAFACNGKEEEESFVRLVMEVMCMLEMHEAMEFFLYKGKRVYDPHKMHVGEERG